MSRPLNHSELAAYTHVNRSVSKRARIKSLLWMPGSFRGITLGRFIFLTTDEPSDGTSTLIAHELVHVEQYADVGIIAFFRRYLIEFFAGLRKHRKWMRAYSDINVEAEARQRTADWSRQHQR